MIGIGVMKLFRVAFTEFFFLFFSFFPQRISDII